MRRLCLLFLLLLSTGPLSAQDTISVDAVSAMHVCSPKNPASAGPCATAPRPLSTVNPSYPEKAREKRKEGIVTLGLTVNKDGSVSGVHVVKGVDKDIDQAAVEAVISKARSSCIRRCSTGSSPPRRTSSVPARRQ